MRQGRVPQCGLDQKDMYPKMQIGKRGSPIGTHQARVAGSRKQCIRVARDRLGENHRALGEADFSRGHYIRARFKAC